MATTTSATERVPSETTNLDIYGDPPLPWQRVLDAIDRTPNDQHLTWWLGTVRPDGRAHVAGVGGFWHDGYLYFTSSPRARKAQNLVNNPSATMAVHLDGIDLVFEGDVERVTDHSTLEIVAKLGREGGWPAEVEGNAVTAPFSAPSAGPPPGTSTGSPSTPSSAWRPTSRTGRPAGASPTETLRRVDAGLLGFPAHLDMKVHVGYVPREHDREDTRRLAAAFGIDIPREHID